MSPPDGQSLQAADRLQQRLSGGLTRSFAKLYSQHTRLAAQRPGLKGWGLLESSRRLGDAARLLEAGFLQREAGHEGWRDAMRRAAELLEWLAHPSLNPEGLPIRFLSAATYQLAGYPARASSLLDEEVGEAEESRILRAFLRSEFRELLALLGQNWAEVLPAHDPPESPASRDGVELTSGWLQTRIVRETVSSLGVLCGAIRWGDGHRLDRAIEKLRLVGKVLVQGDDPYSWLLARLCAEVASTYSEETMRALTAGLVAEVGEIGRLAFDRYLRQGYLQNKSVAWPSQARGIGRLVGGGSFALCTPTGSGKTTIAELAILRSLFTDPELQGDAQAIDAVKPLAMYLVPSRALAAEVESKLSRVLAKLGEERVRVTGLYGGTDWGPTDAWMTATERTVLICTYEKAEALMRFLGPLFLERLALVVLDEAHSVQFEDRSGSGQVVGNRSLNLESLGMRLFAHLERHHCRIIALSAVAVGMDEALAKWVSGRSDATAVTTLYRSTRQLIGRLECVNRGFEIGYDLLDGGGLSFEGQDPAETPFIPSPFPPHPPAADWEGKGPEKRLRPPLLWAAMQLAAPDDRGRRHGVLISIAQDIGSYAADFLTLLERTWSNDGLPDFFQPPEDPGRREIWERCLRSSEDYFGSDSPECRLLRRGIVLHYGKMPGLTARLLVQVVVEEIVSLVLATSTLSEGVNLPFETVLIPSLRRFSGDIPPREFANLIGRAGRPGHGTEGRALVLLDRAASDRGAREGRQRYVNLVRALGGGGQGALGAAEPSSPLAQLLIQLFHRWQAIGQPGGQVAFLRWLEQTAPLDFEESDGDPASEAIESLDTLDGILLSVIVELEQLGKDDEPGELEGSLKRVWARSYARFARAREADLEGWFLRRGQALRTTIYPDKAQRRRLYRTCLSPRPAQLLLERYPSIRRYLQTGAGYARQSPVERLRFVEGVVAQVGTISRFSYKEKAGRSKVDWRDVLAWWLDPIRAKIRPTAKQVSDWHKYVGDNFGYRFNWGLGSVTALAIDEVHGGELMATRLEEWPLTGLPWAAFWIKELLVWGTLEPVAAYLLAMGKVWTRQDAEVAAEKYYRETTQVGDPDELLNAIRVREWVSLVYGPLEDLKPKGPPRELDVELAVGEGVEMPPRWRVIPLEHAGEILWYDIAGYPLARCRRPDQWKIEYLTNFDFFLDTERRVVVSSPYF